MSETTEKSLTYLDKFEQLAIDYTPKVIDAGVAIARIEGIQKLIYGMIGFLLFFGPIYLLLKNKQIFIDNTEEFHIFMSFSLLFSFVGLFLVSNLFNIWNYIAIFHPELYIGYKIIN